MRPPSHRAKQAQGGGADLVKLIELIATVASLAETVASLHDELRDLSKAVAKLLKKKPAPEPEPEPKAGGDK